MKFTRLPVAITLGACMALAWANPAATGFEGLSSAGEKVLKVCNPGSSNSVGECRVASLPGDDGFELVGSRSAPVIVNGVTVGTQYEKAWRHRVDKKLHVFGVRLQMNADAWDDSGAAFNVNDLFRQTRTDKPVEIAYFAGVPAGTKLLQFAGRTFSGLNEYEGAQPPRNKAWVGFRIDVNAAQSSGPSSANSPWLLTKARAPEGYAVQNFALRLLNSENPDRDQNSIYTAGYQPVCSSEDCAPVDGDD